VVEQFHLKEQFRKPEKTDGVCTLTIAPAIIGTCTSKTMILAVNTEASGTGSAGGQRTLPIVSCIGSTETRARVRLDPAAAQGTFSSFTSIAGIGSINHGTNKSQLKQPTFDDGCFIAGKYTKALADLNNTAEQPSGNGRA
jgi:hypothetical protein